MTLFKLEHSRTEYFADFAVYTVAIFLASVYVALYAPSAAWLEVAAAAAAGLATFSLLEYLVHRFVFHGPEPFRSWHAEHHRRPQALIGTPTIVTGAILVLVIFLPAAVIGNRWLAFGLSLGMAMGFLAYGWVHHWTHHGRARTGWMKNRKRVHAIHHGSGGVCLYGVTTSVWDRLFRSVSV